MDRIVSTLPKVTSPTETIFGNEAAEPRRSDDDAGSESGDEGGSKSRDQDRQKEDIVPKEFFWDQFIKYLATAIALLTVLDIALQFFQGGNLFCYPPLGYQADTLDATARDQAAYINTFCLQSLTRSEFYPVFILIEGIILIAPQYLWLSLFGGQFDFFFAIVRQLDRLRDTDSGEYRQNNFELVKRLEKEFPDSPKWFGILYIYRLKLALQAGVAVLSIVLNGAVFPPNLFDFAFECPMAKFDANNASQVPEGWLFPFSVQCVYSSFRVLPKIWFANMLLLLGAMLLALYGLLWTIKRHTNALGYGEIAHFAYTSCLPPDEYVFSHFSSKPCTPRMMNDLDFLLLRLFRADSGHGRVFKDILIDKELKRLINEDHERLHLYIDAIKDQRFLTLSKRKQDASLYTAKTI